MSLPFSTMSFHTLIDSSIIALISASFSPFFFSRFLNFTKLFLDGTDALVNGSKHYKITLDEINALKQLKKWNILHNNTKNSINRTKLILEEKLEIYAHDED